MGTTDPRLLINALGDLKEECARWAIEARESLDAAEVFQRRHEEVVRQTERRSQIVANEAKEDRDHVQRAQEDVERLLDQCEEARHRAADLLKAAQEALQLAQRTLKHWEAELDKALKWLERALARLQRAEVELKAAEWEYRDAQSDLEDAVRALRRCQNDDNRRNCWSERAAVAAAQERLQYAKVRLELAIEEYQAAQEEVRQAQARVACCRQAVGYAQKAVQAGRDAVSRAEAALAAAERSLEHVRAARRMVEKAHENVESELNEAEQMVIAAGHADRAAHEAERSRRKADAANQSAQRMLTGSRMELEYRVGQLAKLNQATLMGVGSVRPTRSGPSTAQVTAMHARADKVEREAKRYLKAMMGCHTSGLGLHYGRQGLDVYGIRNTPKGKSLLRMEVKSTGDLTKKGSEAEVLNLLKTDKKGLQQGSRLYGENRLHKATSQGSRVARNIRTDQARWTIKQSRDYVYWGNTNTGVRKVFRVISSPDGRTVNALKLIKEWRMP